MSRNRILSTSILFAASFCGVWAIMATVFALRPVTSDIALSELPSIYERMDEGMEIKDNRQAVSDTAPDFVAVSRKGVRSSADELRNDLQGVFYHGRRFSSKTKILSVMVKDGKTFTTISTHLEYEIIGTTLTAPGVAAQCAYDAVSVDTWTKDFGQWRLHRSQEVRSRETIDGQLQ